MCSNYLKLPSIGYRSNDIRGRPRCLLKTAAPSARRLTRRPREREQAPHVARLAGLSLLPRCPALPPPQPSPPPPNQNQKAGFRAGQSPPGTNIRKSRGPAGPKPGRPESAPHHQRIQLKIKPLPTHQQYIETAIHIHRRETQQKQIAPYTQTP